MKIWTWAVLSEMWLNSIFWRCEYFHSMNDSYTYLYFNNNIFPIILSNLLLLYVAFINFNGNLNRAIYLVFNHFLLTFIILIKQINLSNKDLFKTWVFFLVFWIGYNIYSWVRMNWIQRAHQVKNVMVEHTSLCTSLNNSWTDEIRKYSYLLSVLNSIIWNSLNLWFSSHKIFQCSYIF